MCVLSTGDFSFYFLLLNFDFRNDDRRFDFYQYIIPKQLAHFHQCTCGRFRGVDELITNIPHLLYLRYITHIVAKFYNVIHGAAAVDNAIAKIDEYLFCLFTQVIFTNKIALLIQCHLPGNDEHGAVAKIDLRNMRVTFGCGYGRGIDELYDRRIFLRVCIQYDK